MMLNSICSLVSLLPEMLAFTGVSAEELYQLQLRHSLA